MTYEKHEIKQTENNFFRNRPDQVWLMRWNEKTSFTRKCFQTFDDQDAALNFLVENILPNPRREYLGTLFASATIHGEINTGTIDLRTLL